MVRDDETIGSRDRVLDQIRIASVPPTVDEIAAALGLHRNSVRTHITSLHRDGLIYQESRASGGRGRPLATYRLTTSGARAGARNYQLLAEVLVGHIAATTDDAEQAAREAGRVWGTRIARERSGSPDQLVPEVLAELGFEPAANDEQIDLRNCPFRELVDSHQGLICSLHAGMLDGVVGDRARVRLLPFITPTTCAVHLQT